MLLLPYYVLIANRRSLGTLLQNWLPYRPTPSPLGRASVVRTSVAMMATTLLIVAAFSSPAASLSGGRVEDRWHPFHISQLPDEIRRPLARLERICGSPPMAEHYFATYLSGRGQQFISLHFEHFRCNSRSAICPQEVCLHQVYVSTAGRFRLSVSVHVPELEMKLIEDAPAIEIACEGPSVGCTRVLIWNGTRFVSPPQLNLKGNRSLAKPQHDCNGRATKLGCGS